MHRLLASKGSTSKPQRKIMLRALERLAEGLFTISWQGAIVAFWTDREGTGMQQETEWQLQVEGDEITVPAFTAGAKLVQRVCLDGVTEDILTGYPAIVRTFRAGEQENRAGSHSAEAGREPILSPEIETAQGNAGPEVRRFDTL